MSPKGLWRDGRFLVIDPLTVAFPDRCVWTNEPVTGELTEVELCHREIEDRGVVMNIKTHKMRISMPVSANWIDRRKLLQRKVGKVLKYVGLVLLAIGLVAIVCLANILPDPPPPLMITQGLLFAFGIILTAVGFAWPYLEERPGESDLYWCFMTDRYIWLHEANKKFLADMPEWDGPSRKSLPRPS